jgi:hypothetical protein
MHHAHRITHTTALQSEGHSSCAAHLELCRERLTLAVKPRRLLASLSSTFSGFKSQ